MMADLKPRPSLSAKTRVFDFFRSLFKIGFLVYDGIENFPLRNHFSRVRSAQSWCP